MSKYFLTIHSVSFMDFMDLFILCTFDNNRRVQVSIIFNSTLIIQECRRLCFKYLSTNNSHVLRCSWSISTSWCARLSPIPYYNWICVLLDDVGFTWSSFCQLWFYWNFHLNLTWICVADPVLNISTWCVVKVIHVCMLSRMFFFENSVL